MRDRHTATPQFLRGLDAAGIPTPKPVQDAAARHRRIEKGVGNLGHAAEQISARVADALADGEDPAAAPGVLEAVVSQMLTTEGMRRTIAATGREQLATTISEHGDIILDNMRQPFDQAVTHLLSAHDSLGDVDLTQAHAILNQGGDAAAQWSTAVESIKTIEALVHLRGMLAVVADWPRHTMYRELEWTAPTARQWATRPNTKGTHVWERVCQGVPLTLASPAEWATRRRTVTADSLVNS